ncbi:MAG: thiol:disulfide interchange protein DsbA/DsbL [Candidatus Porifericomitaceae bacterium WSBS_2022_MAG_OTU9]
MNKTIKFMVGAMALVLASAYALAEKPSYTIIDKPAPTEELEVIEFFWYGCPHCYRLESHLENWLKEKDANVTFRRIPAALGDQWLPHAKAFYVAEKLGILDKVHSALFERIHKHGQPTSNRRLLKKFFASFGVDGKEFDAIYNSDETTKKIKQSILYSTRIKLQGVPGLVVNGKYLVTGRSAGSNEGMISTVQKLLSEAMADAASSGQEQ